MSCHVLDWMAEMDVGKIKSYFLVVVMALSGCHSTSADIS